MVRIVAVLTLTLAGWWGTMTLGQHARAERDSWTAVEGHKSTFAFAGPIVNRQLMADVTWFRTLVYYADAQDAGGDFRYLESFLDTILALDPGFERVYRWAAYAATYRDGPPSQKEFQTSLKYLDLAMARYPENYEYFWLAGLRYWLDLKSDDPDQQRSYKERGADLIDLAMRKDNAPPRLPTLAATMRTRLGQHERAIRDLREMILTAEDEHTRKLMLNRFRQISERPDLTDELESFAKAFEEGWSDTLPFAPPTLYVLLGPRPAAAFDFADLATEHDLFGVAPVLELESEPGLESEPEPEPEPRLKSEP